MTSTFPTAGSKVQEGIQTSSTQMLRETLYTKAQHDKRNSVPRSVFKLKQIHIDKCVHAHRSGIGSGDLGQHNDLAVATWPPADRARSVMTTRVLALVLPEPLSWN
jgi:hypothetical protein